PASANAVSANAIIAAIGVTLDLAALARTASDIPSNAGLQLISAIFEVRRVDDYKHLGAHLARVVAWQAGPRLRIPGAWLDGRVPLQLLAAGSKLLGLA